MCDKIESGKSDIVGDTGGSGEGGKSGGSDVGKIVLKPKPKPYIPSERLIPNPGPNPHPNPGPRPKPKPMTPDDYLRYIEEHSSMHPFRPLLY